MNLPFSSRIVVRTLAAFEFFGAISAFIFLDAAAARARRVGSQHAGSCDI
jgi:hypothetical protein